MRNHFRLRIGAAVRIAASVATLSCDVTGPETGALRVTVMTTGAELDLDGYVVVLDGSLESPISPGANSTQFLGVIKGTHTVELRNVADNCAASPAQEADVVSGVITQVAFSVICLSTGIRVQVTTSGLDHDLDGYTLEIDGANRRRVAAAGFYVITGLQPGRHSLTLSAVAENCAISGGSFLSFDLMRGEMKEISISVSCTRMWELAYATMENTALFAIMVATSDHANVQRLASGADPAWSPDGRRIAYIDLGSCDWYDYVPPCPTAGVWLIGLDQYEPRRLTTGADLSPAWSPDGNRLAFTRTSADYRTQLAILTLDNSLVRSVLVAATDVYSPSWSPDGKTVVFGCSFDAGGTDVCSVAPDGSSFTRLTAASDAYRGAPKWSPDGDRIVFVEYRAGKTLLTTVAPDGSDLRYITDDLRVADPDWLPDGRIGYVEGSCAPMSPCTNLMLMAINRDGSGRSILSNPNRYVSAPHWRP